MRRNPIHDLASRLLGVCFQHSAFEFILKQASTSDHQGESLHIYLPPNLSLAQTALVTAAILVELSDPQKIEEAIASQVRLTGDWFREPEVRPQVSFDLIEQLQQLLGG